MQVISHLKHWQAWTRVTTSWEISGRWPIIFLPCEHNVEFKLLGLVGSPYFSNASLLELLPCIHVTPRASCSMPRSIFFSPVFLDSCNRFAKKEGLLVVYNRRLDKLGNCESTVADSLVNLSSRLKSSDNLTAIWMFYCRVSWSLLQSYNHEHWCSALLYVVLFYTLVVIDCSKMYWGGERSLQPKLFCEATLLHIKLLINKIFPSGDRKKYSVTIWQMWRV